MAIKIFLKNGRNNVPHNNIEWIAFSFHERLNQEGKIMWTAKIKLLNITRHFNRSDLPVQCDVSLKVESMEVLKVSIQSNYFWDELLALLNFKVIVSLNY